MLSPAEKATEHRIGFGFRAHDAEEQKEEKKSELPALVLDGDALNILSELEGWQNMVPEGSVLTPHPGEMARLTGLTTIAVQHDRINVARTFAREHQVIVVLKGHRTLIAWPDGNIWVNTTGNPGMATGVQVTS